MKVAIIMPAYNEEKRIGRTLEAYGKFFSEKKKIGNLDYQIIVVINNTTDKTEEIVKEAKKDCKDIRYLNFKRGGKGFAITEGFKEAIKEKFDLIGFVDADLSTSPEYFYDLIDKIEDYDGIIASRYIKGAIVKPKQKVMRIIASRVFNFIVRVLFLIPYKDTQLGAKLFKRKAIEKILPNLGITLWAYDVDLLYNAKIDNMRIREVATVWQDSAYSHIDLKKSSIQMLFSVLRLRIVHSKFKRIMLKAFNPITGVVWKILK